MNIKSFTDPTVLAQIGNARVHKFLSEFDPDLAVANISLPSPEIENGSFLESVSTTLRLPTLPARLCDALAVLEGAASAENQGKLDEAIARRLSCVSVSRTCALDRALELWFQARDELSQFAPPSERPSDGNTEAPATEAAEVTENENQKSDLAVFQHLASLSPADYDRARKAEAKRLGIRVETLDAEVDRHRQLSDDQKAREVILNSVVPWPEPVNGAEVLDQVSSRFTLHIVLPACAADAISLWEAHAHVFTAFPLSPRLNLSSPEPGCGKTTTLDLIAAMTPRALRTENLTAPVLFRVVDQRQPVLLLDEVDTFLHQDKELRGLLHAGHKRGGCACRCEGTNNAVRAFKAFSPAVLSGIGPLPATLHDRSICIFLVKAKEGEVTAHFNELKADIETELRRKLARWTQDNYAAIAACDPLMPKAAFNRLGDNWRPLFAIAQIAGGDWPARVLAAFNHLTAASNLPRPLALPLPRSAPGPSTADLQLLSDIREIFASRNATRIFTKDLLAALSLLPGRSWSSPSSNPSIHQSTNPSEPPTPAWLARRLSRFAVRPQVLVIGGIRGKGYKRAAFANAFSLLPPSSE